MFTFQYYRYLCMRSCQPFDRRSQCNSSDGRSWQRVIKPFSIRLSLTYNDNNKLYEIFAQYIPGDVDEDFQVSVNFIFVRS